MSETVLDVDATVSVAALEDAVDSLLTGSLDSCSDAQVLDVWRRLEITRRRLDAVEVRVIEAVQTQSLPFAQGCKSTIDLARYLLHLSPAEAALRVRNTANLAHRVMPSGEAVSPVYPVVAAALSAGTISGRAADVITKTVDKLDPVLSPRCRGCGRAGAGRLRRRPRPEPACHPRPGPAQRVGSGVRLPGGRAASAAPRPDPVPSCGRVRHPDRRTDRPDRRTARHGAGQLVGAAAGCRRGP